MPRLQNAVILAIDKITTQRGTVCWSCWPYVAEKTAADSTIRQFIVHQCAFSLNPDVVRKNPGSFRKDLLADMAVVLMEKHLARSPDDLATFKKDGTGRRFSTNIEAFMVLEN